MSTKFLSPGWRMPRNANQSKQSNYSMNFNGSSQYIDLGNSTQVQPVKEMSISAWINASSFTFSTGIVSCMYNGSSYDGFALRLDDTFSNKIQFVVNSTTQIKSTSTITTGQWYHLVATYDGANIKLYFNGSLESSTSLTGNIDYSDGSRTTNIGSLYSVGANEFEFPGQINQVSIFDYALSASQVTTLWGGGTSVSNPMALPRTPIAYYPLGTSAYNGEYLAENNAIGDYVFSFSGSNAQSVNCGNDNSLQATTALTLSAWIKYTTDDTNFRYVLTRRDLNDTNYMLYLNNTTGSKTLKFGSNGTATSSGSVTYNQWHHVAVTVNGTSVSFYIDGQPAGTSTITGINSFADKDFIIGDVSYSTTYEFAGLISNPKMFNIVLSPTEVATLYNYGSPIQTLASIPQSSNLKAWYKLDASEIYNSSSTEWEINNALSPWTSSLDFNSNSYLSGASSISPTSQLTLSAWVNMDSHSGGTGSNELPMVFSKLKSGTGPASGEGGFALFYLGGFTFRLNEGSSQGAQITSNVANTLNTWEHIAVTYNGSNMKIFVNGILRAINSYSQAIGETSLQTLGVGVATNLTYGEFPGKISNAQIWYSALTDGSTTTLGNTAGGEVAALYNSGAPLQALASIPQNSNLKAWWQMNNLTTGIQDSSNNNNNITNSGAVEAVGSVSTLNGTSSGMSQANLVQSDLQTVAPYSKYALDFDSASTSYVNVGNNSSINSLNQITGSVWAKFTGTSNDVYAVFANWGSSTKFSFEYQKTTSTNSRNIRLRINYGNNTLSSYFITYADLSDDNWHHLVFTIDGTTNANGINIYVDGAKLSSFTATNTGLYNSSVDTLIGSRYTNSTWDMEGPISNVSVWNTDLTSAQITEIYNEGLPSDLNSHSAYSNLVSWWQLGENSSFDGSNWICADEKGTNNGTSTGMPVGALVNGVGTTANGVSASMGVGSLVGDAPYSTANAISSGMSVVSRVTGSGNTP